MAPTLPRPIVLSLSKDAPEWALRLRHGPSTSSGQAKAGSAAPAEKEVPL